MLPDRFLRLADLLAGRRVVALTGAGCNTESGIPGYRGPKTRERSADPIRYGDFLRDPEARRQYRARSVAGWPRVDRARPNTAHRALARLEREGGAAGGIAQNVDGLHGEAGSAGGKRGDEERGPAGRTGADRPPRGREEHPPTLRRFQIKPSWRTSRTIEPRRIRRCGS